LIVSGAHVGANQEPLPEIAIPLLPGDPYTVVELQPVFDRCYETGCYRRRVRYAELALNPPLDEKQIEWVRQLHCEAGIAK
jgi:hypothetical protein